MCHDDVHRAASSRAASCRADGAGGSADRDALSHDTTVLALARHLGVAWHTAWTAIETEAKARVAKPERFAGVKTLGVDEHIWWPSQIAADRAVTIMVDLTRDQDGCLHARLLDAVVGRSEPPIRPGCRPNPTDSPRPSNRPR